jgi:transcription initiation factor TFIIIB Brf1 subunit/transcription initiation factor TFIIB
MADEYYDNILKIYNETSLTCGPKSANPLICSGEVLNTDYNRPSKRLMQEWSDESSVVSEEGECNHNLINENGMITCSECGMEMKKSILNDKEWRYFNNSDSGRSGDPSRVCIRKMDDKNIYKDVEGFGFSDKIILKANNIYTHVTNSKIFRGNSRKSIVFACIFHAFKMEGIPQSHDKLIEIFKITRKSGLKGIKHVNLNSSKEIRLNMTHITPDHLLKTILENFKASTDQHQEVVDLYNTVKNRSSKLNRSRPQSIAAGVAFYWITHKKIGISIKEFANIVNLSEITISKMIKELTIVLANIR